MLAVNFGSFNFSDRFRTAINVEGDSLGAGIVAHMSRHELAAIDAAAAGSIDGSDSGGSDLPKKKKPSPPPSYEGINVGFQGDDGREIETQYL